MVSSAEGVSKIVASVVVVIVSILIIILASVLVTNSRNTMNAMKKQIDDVVASSAPNDAAAQGTIAFLRAQHSQLMSWMWIWAVVLVLGIVWLIIGIAGVIKGSSMNSTYDAMKEAMLRRLGGIAPEAKETAASAAQAATFLMQDMF